MDSIVHRDLDGYYFRVKRGDAKYDNFCWSDMTEEERYQMLEGFDMDAIKRFCVELGTVIRNIGDQLDLVCSYED